MSMSRNLKIVTGCGVVPLLLATLIYITWRFTRWPWLETAGIYLLFTGFASIVTGGIVLVRHVWRKSSANNAFRTPSALQVILAASLLLVNFPAAAFYTLSVIDISTRYTIHIFNESGGSIETFIITAPGVHIESGPIAAGQHVIRYPMFKGEGSLNFSANQGPFILTGILDGYVTCGLCGDTSIVVLSGGKYEIHHRHG